MERSKVIISIIVGLAAILIIWRVGFYPPVPEQEKKPGETEAVGAAEPRVRGDIRRPGDANEPRVAFDVNEPRRREFTADIGPRSRRGFADANEPNGPMEFVNLKGMQMRDVIRKLAEWTGKVIIPTDEAMKQKITIYSPKELPRNEAVQMIYAALHTKGYTAEHTEKVIYLKPIQDAKLGEIPTIAADYPLAMIENKDQLAQKIFKLKNFSPAQLGQIILPLVGEYGYVSADETTSSMLVIDTVRNLIRIGQIIEQFDLIEAEEIETVYFEVRHGNPTEIVELLQTLFSDGSSSSVSTRNTGRGRTPPSRPNTRSTRPSSSSTSSRSTGGTAVSVTVGTGRTPAILIPQPRYNWIIVKATAEDIKQIEEWIDRLDRSIPTMLVDEPLEAIENKNQIVQKFFRLENYSASQMGQIVESFLTENGIVSADESTGNLIVTDSVENLLRIRAIIKQFDIPEAEQTVTNYFEILYSDPTELVQILRMLISGEAGTSSRTSSRTSGRSRTVSRTSSIRGSSRSGSSTSVLIGPSQQPVVLIPVPRLKWIIARASAEDMKRIEAWINKLDKEDPIKSEHETVSVRFVDPSEVADRLNEALQQVTGTEFQANVLVQPLVQAKQMLIFGRADMREMVKKLIQEIDIPSGLETKVFKLEHADPDQIKENIDNLYGEDIPSSGLYSSSALYAYYRYGRTQTATDIVKVISFPTMQQVTVIASPENLVKIEEQIKEWDVPLDVEQVKPLIIELENSDPVQMADLLTKLFTEESTGGLSIWDILYGASQEKSKIVGPLYGQLTFADVPGTKKIIVISKIPAAYAVIKQLIFDLDRKEMAEIPKVIELKYADPEDLSERLNAMFVEAGQQARIRLTQQGLSTSSEMGDSESSTSSSSDNTESSDSTYTPPWSGSGARSGIDEEMPISNVIGRVRFVPEPHTKSIMVLAPPEFMDEIEAMIAHLDVPGKQVMIEAIIVEIEHSKVTSLGVELSTNPAAFGTLGENALLALGNITHMGTEGPISGTISSGAGTFGAEGTGTVLGVGTDVYALLDFLIKTTNAKILNQQTLWTKDNEEASFFKGSEVAFLGSVTYQTVGGASQDITFEKVGMELRARPSITPEDKVDMIVNIQISQLTSEIVNSQNVRSKMNTTTNMIVQDGQTLLLGGILFQKESVVEHKLPGFGDVPLVGGLFRHNEAIQSNSEMLVFMTPRVIDEAAEKLPEVAKEDKEKLEDIQEQLEETMEGLEKEMP